MYFYVGEVLSYGALICLEYKATGRFQAQLHPSNLATGNVISTVCLVSFFAIHLWFKVQFFF